MRKIPVKKKQQHIQKTGLPTFGLADIQRKGLYKALVKGDEGREGIIYYKPFPVAEVIHFYRYAGTGEITSERLEGIVRFVASAVCDEDGVLLGTFDQWMEMPVDRVMLVIQSIMTSHNGDKGESLTGAEGAGVEEEAEGNA